MDNKNLLSLVEPVLTALVTLVAAFAGSWYAFRLSDNSRARQTVDEQVAAINRAQFILIRQWNLLRNFQAQTVDPYRNDPARLINMRPRLPVGGTPARIDVDSLSFLLETTDRELVFRLLIEQERFETAIQAINERSRLHIEEVQPRLVAGSILERSEYSEGQVEAAVGSHLLLLLRRATDAVIEQVELTLVSTQAMATEFHLAMKSRFPDRSIIRMIPDVPSNQPLQPTGGEDARRPSKAVAATRG